MVLVFQISDFWRAGKAATTAEIERQPTHPHRLEPELGLN
jgi:hypothetical protein